MELQEPLRPFSVANGYSTDLRCSFGEPPRTLPRIVLADGEWTSPRRKVSRHRMTGAGSDPGMVERMRAQSFVFHQYVSPRTAHTSVQHQELRETLHDLPRSCSAR